MLRPYPSYIELEISSDCNENCIFCPYPVDGRNKKFISTDLIKKISSEIENHKMEDTWVSITGYGEPLLHPEVEEIISIFSTNENISAVILETNGSKGISCL